MVCVNHLRRLLCPCRVLAGVKKGGAWRSQAHDRDRIHSDSEGGRDPEGPLVLPDESGSQLALIGVHEIRGPDDHIKDVARRFARQDYAAPASHLHTGA